MLDSEQNKPSQYYSFLYMILSHNHCHWFLTLTYLEESLDYNYIKTNCIASNRESKV